MSVFKEVSCPSCKSKLCSINITMDHHGTHACLKCHKRIQVDYNHRTSRITKKVVKIL